MSNQANFIVGLWPKTVLLLSLPLPFHVLLPTIPYEPPQQFLSNISVVSGSAAREAIWDQEWNTSKQILRWDPRVRSLTHQMAMVAHYW